MFFSEYSSDTSDSDVGDTFDLPESRSCGENGEDATSHTWTPTELVSMEVLGIGNTDMFIRPCADCGQRTGSWCDLCEARVRYPQEQWTPTQHTPLCTECDKLYLKCHFCRKVPWTTPPAWDKAVLPDATVSTTADDIQVHQSMSLGKGTCCVDRSCGETQSS